MVLYNTTPNPGDILANSQPILLANSQYLQTSVGIDHNFTNNTATAQDGFHKSIHMIVQPDQAPTGNTLTFYQKITDGDTNLYASTSLEQGLRLTTFNSTFDYTLFGTSTNYPPNVVNQDGGWTYLPGGLLLQYGTMKVTGANTAVLFPMSFPTALFSLTANVKSTNGITISSEGVAGFTAITSTSVGTRFYWIAIGN